MIATKLQVQAFLGKLSRLDPKAIQVSMQRKTIDFLAELEMEREDVLACLLLLTASHYSYGPTASDWAAGGDVWIFGDVCKGRPVYIKLCINNAPTGHSMMCMSFHAPERPMRFPYADKKPAGEKSEY